MYVCIYPYVYIHMLSLHRERERMSERVRNETFGLDAEFQRKNVALSRMEKPSKEAEK